MTPKHKNVDHYLELPYTVVLRRDEQGDFVARVDELPGCSAHGRSRPEALENLDEAKRLWITDALESGDAVPEPSDTDSLPSGKWVQRVARTLHLKLVQMARREGTSLNQLVATLLAEAVGRRSVTPETVSLANEDWAHSDWKGWAARTALLAGQSWAISQEPTHAVDLWDMDILDCFSLKLPNRIQTTIEAAEHAKKEEERHHRARA
ncbi:MAG TPA: type II toxin-antitoxin system HicB family antitoxin [Terriglobales bacterium]|nr:type II toxin-antitoxin system HicB family antitoxin [Terriglobales bacterium]